MDLNESSSIEELLTNESFLKYCGGDPKEKVYWERQFNEVEGLRDTAEKAKRLYELVKAEMTDASTETIAFRNMIEQRQAEHPVIALPAKRRARFWAAAAVGLIIVLSGIGIYKYNGAVSPQVVQQEQPANERTDVAPGRNTATLVLADGSVVSLDSTGNGEITKQGNTAIVKTEDGNILYKTEGEKPPETLYNTMSTPRGGQYRLVLPDGTKVWLNAASSIRYPASFPTNERRVTVTGEVYFEVAAMYNPAGKGALIPFTVQKDNMQVQVKGTHFNINAYDDEADMKVTLLEGRVDVSTADGAEQQEVMLVPGRQARCGKTGKIVVANDVNLDEVMAWKNGLFDFSNADIRTIMRQIGRWYDLDVSYEGAISQREFSGKITRNTQLSNVLTILEQSNIHFRMEQNRIIVAP
ncbi:MAG: FecR domain-containing protein [Chitinophagaceae bacterium]|nr:FecR domain-containing protein [Chitinophagaceae bacterium]